jgi:hypothetical protein
VTRGNLPEQRHYVRYIGVEDGGWFNGGPEMYGEIDGGGLLQVNSQPQWSYMETDVARVMAAVWSRTTVRRAGETFRPALAE